MIRQAGFLSKRNLHTKEEGRPGWGGLILSKNLVEFRRARRNKMSTCFVRRRVRRAKHITCRKCEICARFAYKLCTQRHAAFFKREPSKADRV